MSYPEQVQRVAMTLARPPLDAGCKLVIDETGVGRAVGDIFDAAGLYPNRITITAGTEATQQSGNRWHVAKGILISGVDARLAYWRTSNRGGAFGRGRTSRGVERLPAQGLRRGPGDVFHVVPLLSSDSTAAVDLLG
jgi:hypothetical protein